MQSSEQILNDKIGPLLWKFSLPAIVGMVVNSLYNVVDRIFVGRGIGSLGIAATSVAFPIMTLMLAVSVLIGVGTTALISLRLGQQKQEEAEQIAGNGMALLILLPAALTMLFFAFSEPILI
ncbi:MAG: MATE family efflux transporter, partial [Syntrophomonadaceae bacterium]|nr:MATE family efflux transporter [Syntrophomonadaceae bacterium]